MNVRCSTTSISALVLSLCLVTSIPAALSNASTWNELTIKLPYGALWNFFAPLGFAYLGIVAIGLIVLWTGYRKRERWAWFVMLIALLFFYFPSYALPVVLQSRRFGWPHLLDFLGAFRAQGWWHCWIASLRPNYSVGIACGTFLTLIRPLTFLVMSIALLLPVKAFFWKPVPPQPGMRTKVAAQLAKQPLIWVIALLLVIVIAVAFMVRSRVAPSQNSVAENQQPNVMPWFTQYPMVAVALAKAENAIPMPDAGQEGAIVVTVIRDGAVFLEPDRVDPSELGNRIQDKLSNKTDKTIYLRADAFTRYRDVENAIDAMRSARAEKVGLLTQRREDAQPENPLWIGNPLLRSVGLEVFVPSSPRTPAKGPSPPAGTIVVHVVYRPDAAPAYTINAADVAHAELQSKLTEIYASRADHVMFVSGDDNLRFSDIADVIDIGRASNIDRIGLMSDRADDARDHKQ